MPNRGVTFGTPTWYSQIEAEKRGDFSHVRDEEQERALDARSRIYRGWPSVRGGPSPYRERDR